MSLPMLQDRAAAPAAAARRRCRRTAHSLTDALCLRACWDEVYWTVDEDTQDSRHLDLRCAVSVRSESNGDDASLTITGLSVDGMVKCQRASPSGG